MAELMIQHSSHTPQIYKEQLNHKRVHLETISMPLDTYPTFTLDWNTYE